MKINLWEFFKVAVSQLRRNKTRSFLTMLGIIIGVASVILLVAVGNGLRFYIQNQFESLGTDVIFIMPGQSFKKGEYRMGSDFSSFGGTKFDKDDVARLQKIPEVENVAPLVAKTLLVSFAGKEALAEVVGTMTGMSKVKAVKLVEGRFFNKAEEERGARVAILGYKVGDDLFGQTNPIGKKITINNKKYRVLGLVEKKGGAAGMGGVDNRVYIPYKRSFELVGEKKFPYLLVDVVDGSHMEKVKALIKKTLLRRHKDGDFSLADQTEILGVVSGVLGMVTTALAGIAAISLIVGGVGIMNIMFASVTERIKEIGLRKAMGATPTDILLQFLFEALTLSLCGGILGITVGFLFSLLINRFFPAQVTFWSVAVSFGVSTGIGIIFGVVPARKAASLSPIEALRYE